jgi:cytochrome c553
MKRALLLTAVAAAVALGTPASAEEAAGKPDLAKAQQIVNQVCSACHGADGNSPSPPNPNLAGQQADYIALQLAHFKSGIRNNAVMAGMAAALTPEDMRSLGAYFAQQKPKGAAAKDADLAAAGRSCFAAATPPAACRRARRHAPDGAGIPSRYPASAAVCRLHAGPAARVQGGRARHGQGRQGRQRKNHGADRRPDERAGDRGGGAVRGRLALSVQPPEPCQRRRIRRLFYRR